METSEYFVRVYLKGGQDLDIECSSITECKEVFQTLRVGFKNEDEAISFGGNTGIYIRYDEISAIKIFW